MWIWAIWKIMIERLHWMRRMTWQNNDVDVTCSYLRKSMLQYMIFKSFIYDNGWFIFGSKCHSNSYDIVENNFRKIGFKNSQSYGRSGCGIHIHFVIIWIFTNVGMLWFSGDDGTLLEHCTSCGYWAVIFNQSTFVEKKNTPKFSYFE